MITDVVVIGAGASGLMCAIEAGKRGRSVLVVDHAGKPGRKILLSGGGRCNFTNFSINADNYISHNPHFCKSALSRYTPRDFLALLEKHHVAFSEEADGRLFCRRSSRDVLDALLSECRQAGVSFRLNTKIEKVARVGERDFEVRWGGGDITCRSLVVAAGGLSMPSTGASPLGYEIAERFHIKVWPRRAGLVPFLLGDDDRTGLSNLSGISVDAVVGDGRRSFRGGLLFTRRGLSGPAALQISSYWQPGEQLTINLLPEIDLTEELREHQQQHPRRKLKSVISGYLPRRLVSAMLSGDLAEKPLRAVHSKQLDEVAARLQRWKVRPEGTEGYRTAEVTVGGVDCDEISSKTMEARRVTGLFFIGEVLDVTGWLGGYNLQWAWSSGWCAGQHV